MQKQSQQELLEEKARIEKLLARHAKKDPQIPNNYIANYQTVEDSEFEEDDEVFEFSEGELNSDIVQKLEYRLKEINGKIENAKD